MFVPQKNGRRFDFVLLSKSGPYNRSSSNTIYNTTQCTHSRRKKRNEENARGLVCWCISACKLIWNACSVVIVISYFYFFFFAFAFEMGRKCRFRMTLSISQNLWIWMYCNEVENAEICCVLCMMTNTSQKWDFGARKKRCHSIRHTAVKAAHWKRDGE